MIFYFLYYFSSFHFIFIHSPFHFFFSFFLFLFLAFLLHTSVQSHFFYFLFHLKNILATHLLHIRERGLLVRRWRSRSPKGQASGDRHSPRGTTTSAAPPPLILLPTTWVRSAFFFFFFFSFFIFACSDSTLF